MRIIKSILISLLFVCSLMVNVNAQSNQKPDIARLSLLLFSVQGEAKQDIVDQLLSTNDKSLIPTFVLAMRWTGDNIYVAEALSKLTGAKIKDWHDAYNWQERHPEVTPHESYFDLRMRFLGNIDSRFPDLFREPYGNPDAMKIRLEEISWGGVIMDVGIPSLDNPPMIAASEASYLLDDDLVFGVEINGDVRAYPLRIMGWHEMFNDTIGGVPVALAYCTLCGAGILFETDVEGRAEPFVFATSGLLYRSNKLMYDRETQSLWNQFTGEPVVGPLVDSGLKLKIRPNTITSWGEWKKSNPNTKVLSLETGYNRNYDSGFVYRDYFASPDLMFPAYVRDETKVKRKDYVFGIRDVAAARAWPVEAFRETSVINDAVGALDIVLIGNPDTRTVRAYERDAGETFSLNASGQIEMNGEPWEMNEAFLASADGSKKRSRVPGHISYWFSWDNYLGVRSSFYEK